MLQRNNQILYQHAIQNGVDAEQINLTEEESSFLAKVVFTKTRSHDVDLDLDMLPNIKQTIKDFFIEGASRLNEEIDEQNDKESKMENCYYNSDKLKYQEEYIKIEEKIRHMIQRYKEEFDNVIRYQIQDYIALSKQEIENIQEEQKELIGWCASLYNSVCIDEKEINNGDSEL